MIVGSNYKVALPASMYIFTLKRKKGLDMILDVKNISCGYGLKTIVNGISLTVKSGDILCILGPN